MPNRKINLVLADDDDDDRHLFKEVLQELPFPTKLKTVENGAELLALLKSNRIKLPDVIFLDLNMPFKNGLECLRDIKVNERFRGLCVIIFSTSFQQEVADLLYEIGAMYYIQKPDNYARLRDVIRLALGVINENKSDLQKTECEQGTKEKFVLSWRENTQPC